MTDSPKPTERYVLPIAPGPVAIMSFRYTNYRGEVGYRRAVFVGIEFAASEWHPEPQWLMEAIDLDKGERRVFAMRDMSEISHAGA